MLSKVPDLKSARFRLSITGLPAMETTISDTFKVAKNVYVILFSALLGLTVGVFTSLMLYLDDKAWVLPIIVFPLLPIIINFLANYLAATYIILYGIFTYESFKHKCPEIQTIYSILVPATLVWLILIYIHDIFFPEQDIYFVFLIIIPVVYTSVSEFVHYILYRYIIHDIEQDEYPTSNSTTSTAATTGTTVRMDKARLTQQTSETVTIGKQQFKATDILALEAQGNYLKVVTSSGEFTERCQMSTAVEAIDESLGIQIHRSFWVSFSSISALVRVDGNMCVELANGENVKVARPRQNEVRDLLTRRGILRTSPQNS